MKTLLLAFLLSLLNVSAEPSDMATAASPDKAFFAATRRIPDAEYVWKSDLDATRLVIFTHKGDDELGHLYARHDIGTRLVAELRWSPDSQFVVLTTTSAGGHSPYHFETFVFCVSDKSLRYMDDVTGIVLDSAFHFETPDVAVMTVRDSTHEMFEPGDRKTVKVPLRGAVKKMKKM